MKYILAVLFSLIVNPLFAQFIDSGGGGGSSSIISGSTPCTGCTSGNLLSSSGGFVTDSGIGTASLNQTATQILYGNGATGPTSDAGFTKIAGATGLIAINNGGASTPQLTFTPNSGTTSSIGMANAGSQLLIFVGATQAWGFRANAITAVTGGVINWSTSGSLVTTTTDTSLSRNAAGVLQIGTTAINALGSLLLTNITGSGAAIIFNGLATDAAATDTTLCSRSSDGTLLKGSGTLGICLGTSGRQFKTAFEPMVAGLAEINAIPLWNYRYRSGYGDDGARVQFGSTAQDIEAIPALKVLVGHNQNGEAINYDVGALLPISLRAIQELDAKKADRDEVTALRHEIEVFMRNK